MDGVTGHLRLGEEIIRRVLFRGGEGDGRTNSKEEGKTRYPGNPKWIGTRVDGPKDSNDRVVHIKGKRNGNDEKDEKTGTAANTCLLHTWTPQFKLFAGNERTPWGRVGRGKALWRSRGRSSDSHWRILHLSGRLLNSAMIKEKSQKVSKFGGEETKALKEGGEEG